MSLEGGLALKGGLDPQTSDFSGALSFKTDISALMRRSYE